MRKKGIRKWLWRRLRMKWWNDGMVITDNILLIISNIMGDRRNIIVNQLIKLIESLQNKKDNGNWKYAFK